MGNKRIQGLLCPGDDTFRIYALVDVPIQHMQKNQLGLVCLRDLECQIKYLPILAYQGNRVEDSAWRNMSNGASGMRADYKNVDRYFGDQIMSDGAQCELPQFATPMRAHNEPGCIDSAYLFANNIAGSAVQHCSVAGDPL